MPPQEKSMDNDKAEDIRLEIGTIAGALDEGTKTIGSLIESVRYELRELRIIQADMRAALEHIARNLKK